MPGKQRKVAVSIDAKAAERILGATQLKAAGGINLTDLCCDLNKVLLFPELYDQFHDTKATARENQRRIADLQDCALRLRRGIELSGNKRFDVPLANALGRFKYLEGGAICIDPAAELFNSNFALP